MSEQETENKDERERESVRNRGERVRKTSWKKQKERAIERARFYSNRTETDGLRSGQQIYLLLRQPAGH